MALALITNTKSIFRRPGSVVFLAVRYKQRGHIADNLVEHHRQSPLGKVKNGAAVAVSSAVDKNRDVRSVPSDFKLVVRRERSTNSEL